MRSLDQNDPLPPLGAPVKKPEPPPPPPRDRRVTDNGNVREDRDGRFYTTPTGTP